MVGIVYFSLQTDFVLLLYTTSTLAGELLSESMGPKHTTMRPSEVTETPCSPSSSSSSCSNVSSVLRTNLPLLVSISRHK